MAGAEHRIYDSAMRIFAERGQTSLSMSDLARESGVARSTLYLHLTSTDDLFPQIAARLADEMHQRVVTSFGDTSDPAMRLANGVRFFVRRAQEEPHWGRFFTRFALSTASLQGVFMGPPASDLAKGLEAGRFDFRTDQAPSMLAMIAASTLSAMFLVVEGHRGWREAGADAAELLLRAMGLDRDDARQIAQADLPPLAVLP